MKSRGLSMENTKTDLMEKTGTVLLEQDVSASQPAEIELDAVVDNLIRVQAFIDGYLEKILCPDKSRLHIDLAAEEIFVNIASYAYAPAKGSVTVKIEVTEGPAVTITFIDGGVPYDPLAKKDPDVTLSAEARKIGGLGIFLTKKTMDQVSYEFRDGKNILRMTKNI